MQYHEHEPYFLRFGQAMQPLYLGMFTGVPEEPITTHSPYVVDHLTNLIKASKSANHKKAASKFFLKDPSSFITGLLQICAAAQVSV